MPKPKIVVALLNEEQEFQRMQATDARETAARLGLSVEIVFAESHAVLQVQQLFKWIHAPEEDRPAAIVVETVSGEGLERVAKNACAAGISWIILNRSVTYFETLRQAHPKLLVAGLGLDNLEIGHIQGKQCRKTCPGGGRVVVVQGPPDTSAAKLRLAGLNESLTAEYEVRTLAGDWTETSGEKAITGWLRLKTNEAFRPDIIAAQNDSMAMGARRAVSALMKDWGKVAYLGCDGLPDQGIRLVDQHQLAGTVVTPTTTGPAIELVSRWLKTGQAPPVETLLSARAYPA